MYTELFSPQCLSVVPCPTTFHFSPEVEKIESAEANSPIVQQFEISDPVAKACWHKDGTRIYPKRAGACESQPSEPATPSRSCDLLTDEGFGCETFAAHLGVDIKGGAQCCTAQINTKRLS